MVDLARIPFVQAYWYREVPAGTPRPVGLIVLHSMEAPEKGATAESVARYFESGSEGRPASAHYCIDSDSIVQCVQCKDVAFGAPSANRTGIHLEHAGYARQSREEWLDAYSLAMLQTSARLVARVLAPKFHIPLEFVDTAGLKAGRKGITTHREVSRAFSPGGHTDPGEHFPMDVYLQLVVSGAGH
jgi:N-acetyl-anhydromuramyl-L-alanine amidase AmpD